ncbi:MAG TPA: protein kinase [Pseudomonadota bacterium]|nr:protein kinase [Pseudomonadota bacterium]
MPKPDDFVGAYRIVRPIGKGGMGAVFEAVHTRTGKAAAIKVLHARFTDDTEALARFLAEGRATAKLDHASIVRILETGQLPSGACYIAMEYLRGETLGARLKRQGRLGRDALRIGSQIASALVQAHRKNIIHRDLKPSNLILSEGDADGSGRDQVKIIDFGIAKIADDEGGDFRTRTGTMIGTPIYMSPEQCRGVGVTDRTDVYALGVILYQALAGKPPFYSRADGDILAMHILVEPRPLREVEPTLPPPVSEFIARMLIKTAEERPSMAEVATELVRLAEDPTWPVAPAAGPASTSGAAVPPVSAALAADAALDLAPSEEPASIQQVTINEAIESAPPTMMTPPTTTTLAPITGQSASVSAPPTSVRSRRIAVASATGIVVLSLGAALIIRGGLTSQRPPAVSAPQHVVTARPQVTAVPIEPTTVPSPPAPSAQPAPALVRWSVRSQPPGAEVLTESGETLGQTPLSRQHPRAGGTQTLILRLSGYRDAQLSLSLSSDEEREATLVAAEPAKAKPKNFSKRGAGKPRPGQGRHPADDTTILLDFKTKKVLK